jgi:hypothetical protein
VKQAKNWFSIHAIFYYELIDLPQTSYLIHENIYLVEASDWDEAQAIGLEVTKNLQDFNLDGHLELNDQKVRYLLAGIRKIISVETQTEGNEFVARSSGIEVSYSEYEVDTLDEVKALANGEMVNVLYRE